MAVSNRTDRLPLATLVLLLGGLSWLPSGRAAGITAAGTNGVGGQNFTMCNADTSQPGCNVSPYSVENGVYYVSPVSTFIFGGAGTVGYTATGSTTVVSVAGGVGGTGGSNLGLPSAWATSQPDILTDMLDGAPAGGGGLGLLADAGASITNTGTIVGGAGGRGGAANSFGGVAGYAGGGGSGGAAVSGSGFVLLNQGHIAGGAGGSQGSGALAPPGLDPKLLPEDYDYDCAQICQNVPASVGVPGNAAPAIIAGGASTIINEGSIASGGGAAPAIDFVGSGNTLVIGPGSSIGGIVSGTGGNDLELGGSGQGSFDASLGTEYLGFSTLGVSSATWTVSGSNAAELPWTLSGGVMQLGSTSPLGHAAVTFHGGTLRALADLSVANTLSLAGSGTVDNAGHALSLSGLISGAGALVLAGSGLTTLGDTSNSYQGGTVVQAGTTLGIASASVLGGGPLLLQGSASVPATLAVSGNVTLGMPVRVSGDPTFDIPPGKILDVTGVISDGQTPGDVVATGGGTLRLDAADSYSGSTTVDAGTTLALAAGGSIADTSALVNQGTVDLSAAAPTEYLAGSYTQTAGATLIMGLRPGQGPGLHVGGAANLAGTLVLLPHAGRYVLGRYAVLQADAGVSGQFSSYELPGLGTYTTLPHSFSQDARTLYLQLSASTLLQKAVSDELPAVDSVLWGQQALLANLTQYECSEFDARGVCVGVGGGYDVLGSDGPRTVFGQLQFGLRVGRSLRLGAWLQQPTSQQSGSAGVASFTSSRPAMGLSARWVQRAHATGWVVRAALGYARQDVRIRRDNPQLGAATGMTSVVAKAVQADVGWRWLREGRWSVTPYLGWRHDSTLLGGFTDHSDRAPMIDGLPAQWTFSDLFEHSSGARLGLRMQVRVNAHLSLKLETWAQHLNSYSAGSWTLTSYPGITPVTPGTLPRRNVAGSELQMQWRTGSHQRVVLTLGAQQQALGSQWIVGSGLVWQIGF